MVIDRDLSNYWNQCDAIPTSFLWHLAALPSDIEFGREANIFYVKSLLNLIDPVKAGQYSNRLRLSQIPGRSPTTVRKKSNLPQNSCRSRRQPAHIQIPSKMAQNEIPGQSIYAEMLAQLVDSPVCSDLTVIVDSGASISAHRFILAAWNPQLVLLNVII